MQTWLACSSLLAAGLLGIADAETVEKNINADNFVRRAYHAAEIVDTHLYVYGGLVSYTNGAQTSFNSSGAIQTLDLSTDWSPSTAKFNATELPSSVANLSRSTLWYHKADGLLYTGLVGETANYAWNNSPRQPFGLYAYSPKDGVWSTALSSSSSAVQGFVRPDSALTAYGNDIGYALDGSDPSGNRLGGLFQVDLNTKTLSNSSISSTYGSRIYHGSMQFVPIYGAQGIIVAMGGQFFGDAWADMSILHVYDPVAKVFYNQTATGDIPDGRADFCNAGVESTAGTYEIFFYAGAHTAGKASDQSQYDTVHILSLPAFHWVKVSYTATSTRTSHTCNNFNNTAQVISLGGTDPGADQGNYNLTSQVYMSTKDPKPQGLGIFDMTSLTWNDKFNPKAPPYVQSDPVKQYYSQAGKSYESNWNPPVAALLRNVRTSSAGSSSSTAAASKSGSGDSSGSNTGAIAGGVVGGIAGLAMIAGVLWVYLRRRRNLAKDKRNETSGELAANEQFDSKSGGVYQHDPKGYYHEAGDTYHSEAGGIERKWEMDGNAVHETEANAPRKMYEMDGSTTQQRR